MKVFVPVLVGGDAAESQVCRFLDCLEWQECFAKAITRLKPFELRVLSNSGAVADRLRRIIPCELRALGPLGGSSAQLPPGTAELMRALIDEAVIDAASRVAILDYRKPMWSAARLERSLEELECERAAAVTSCELIRDHPAQFESYRTLLDVETLLWVDEDFAESVDSNSRCLLEAAGLARGEMLASVPVSYPWHLYDVYGKKPRGQLCCHVVEGEEVVLFTLEELLQASLQWPRELGGLLYWESEQQARWVTFGRGLARTPGEALAIPFGKALRMSSSVMSRARDAEAALYLSSGLLRGELALQSWALEEGGLRPARGSGGASFGLAEADSGPGLTLDGRRFRGPVARGESGALGAVVALHREACGAADFEWMYEPGVGRWSADPGQKLRVDSRTGCSILGRQDLPRLHQPSGVMTIAEAGAFEGIESILKGGGARGVDLGLTEEEEARLRFEQIRWETLR